MANILYVANIRMPTDRAHGVQVANMCHALAENGHAVTLLVPKIPSTIIDDAFSYYGLPQSFTIKYVWVPNFFRMTQFGWHLNWLVLALRSMVHYLWQRSYEYVYVRDERISLFLSWCSDQIIWEPHEGKVNWLVRRLMRRARVIIPLTAGVKEDLVHAGADADKMLVAHDAIRLEQYADLPEKAAARTALGWSEEETIAVYTGHLFAWKGVYTLADAARQCGETVRVVFVGGLPADVERLRAYTKELANITVVGYRPPTEIPRYLAAADMVLLPNSGNVPISARYTSPLKLFEYMASRRPIIASDLPSLREVLNELTAVLVSADNAAALATAMQSLDPHAATTRERVENAYQAVKANTWYNRAKRIMQFVDKVR